MNYGESGGGLSASDVALINGRNNDNGFGDNGAWWIILFLIFGFGRGGYGFGGNGGSTSVYEGYVLNNDFSQISRQISDTTAMTERKLDSITNGICTLGYDNLVQANSINSNISNLGMTLQNCCCDLKGIAKDNRYDTMQSINTLNNNINSGFVAVNQANCLNTRDIIENQNAGTREILKALCDEKIERKNEQIAMQQNEINALRLSASQSAQNEYLLNSLRNGCPVNAQLVCGNQPIPVQYVQAGCNCGCNCGM